MRVRIGDVAVALFVLACAAFAALQTIGWPARTKVFPLAISLPLIVMLIAHLVLVALAARSPAARSVTTIALSGEDAAGWLPDLRRGIAFGVWMAAYAATLWLFGFMVAGPAMTLAFLRFFGRDSWVASGIFAAGVWGFLYVMREVLHLPLHQGVIGWPFQ